LDEERKEVTVRHEQEILVSVHKYDGTRHRSWPARLAKKEGSLLVLDATFQEDIDHALLGLISTGTLSTEYYWLDRWYNVFRFSEPDRSLKSFYCNVNLPPEFDGQVLTYIDLDIDVLVNPDLSYRILDIDDFKENAKRYAYPAEIQENAHRAVDELLALIESKEFPFSE
jgi:protein associated with RNAse G/E